MEDPTRAAQSAAIEYVLTCFAESRWNENLILSGTLPLTLWFGPDSPEVYHPADRHERLGNLRWIVTPAFGSADYRATALVDDLVDTLTPTSPGPGGVRCTGIEREHRDETCACPHRNCCAPEVVLYLDLTVGGLTITLDVQLILALDLHRRPEVLLLPRDGESAQLASYAVDHSAALFDCLRSVLLDDLGPGVHQAALLAERTEIDWEWLRAELDLHFGADIRDRGGRLRAKARHLKRPERARIDAALEPLWSPEPLQAPRRTGNGPRR